MNVYLQCKIFEAQAMGGNVLYLPTEQSGDAGSSDADGDGTYQMNVELVGHVYRCPQT